LNRAWGSKSSGGTSNIFKSPTTNSSRDYMTQRRDAKYELLDIFVHRLFLTFTINISFVCQLYTYNVI